MGIRRGNHLRDIRDLGRSARGLGRSGGARAALEAGIKKGGILMGVRPRSNDDASFFADDRKRNRAAAVDA
jgi:hypothetical protein